MNGPTIRGSVATGSAHDKSVSGGKQSQDAMLAGLFAAIDAKDTERFLSYLTESPRFRFGSAPAVEGRAAVREAVQAFFDSITGLEHSVAVSASVGTTLFTEGDVTYTRHDGSRITLPFADVFEMRDGWIADYKIYMDIGPLYAV